MGRYLPGAILAVFGVIAYVIGCVLFLAYRRQFPRGRAGKSPPAANDNSGPNTGSKTLLIYAIAMIVLGVLALGAGLYALEVTEIHALRG
jgi:hypothetical protein